MHSWRVIPFTQAFSQNSHDSMVLSFQLIFFIHDGMFPLPAPQAKSFHEMVTSSGALVKSPFEIWLFKNFNARMVGGAICARDSWGSGMRRGKWVQHLNSGLLKK